MGVIRIEQEKCRDYICNMKHGRHSTDCSSCGCCWFRAGRNGQPHWKVQVRWQQRTLPGRQGDLEWGPLGSCECLCAFREHTREPGRAEGSPSQRPEEDCDGQKDRGPWFAALQHQEMTLWQLCTWTPVALRKVGQWGKALPELLSCMKAASCLLTDQTRIATLHR